MGVYAPTNSTVIARLDRAIQYDRELSARYRRLWNAGSPLSRG